MFQIIDKRGNGKTSRLMLLVKEKNGILVCSNPEAMKVKADAYGFHDLEIISYLEYIENVNSFHKPIFIDELEDFVKILSYCQLAGYSLTEGEN
jgi:hypothetical protein